MDDFKIISSKENSLIKLVSALQSSSKQRKSNGLFVLEGKRILMDAMDNKIRFDKLIISDSAFEKFEDSVNEFKENSDECYRIPDFLFKKVSDTLTPQGFIAVAKIKDKNADINKNGRYIALENLQDPTNLGAVARTSEALGLDGIILSNNGCDPYSPKSLRASMGTLLRMPLVIFDDFSNDIKNSGLKIFSSVVDKTAVPISSVEFTDGCVVIIGNEANGITKDTKEISDKLITIPMNGKAESLNAAAASAIVMWEMMRK